MGGWVERSDIEIVQISIFFINPSTKTYLACFCFELNDVHGAQTKGLDKWDLCFVIYMFLFWGYNSTNLSLFIKGYCQNSRW